MNERTQICVIGLGKLGLPIAEIFSEYYKVKGYDVEPKVSSKIDVVLDLKDAIKDSDFIFIFAPTPHSQDYSGETPTHNLPPRDFDYTKVQDVLKEINVYVTNKQTVVLVSTVLPGTIREQLAPLLTNAPLIYNPYLVAMGTEASDMAEPECLIIGTKEGTINDSVLKVTDFYKPFIKNDPPVNIGTWEEAESIKVFYNTFISLKLSFVNMIQDVTARIGNADVEVVINALTSATKRILSPRYMIPGLGDGGPCHPRDNIALRYLSEKLNLGYDLFQGIVESRDKQAKNFAKFISDIAKEKQLPVYLHGKTYKRGLPYTQGSYSLLVNFYLELLGHKTTFIDPITDPCEGDLTEPIVLVATHPINGKYMPYINIPMGSIVIDPWRTAKYLLAAEVIDYGNTRSV